MHQKCRLILLGLSLAIPFQAWGFDYFQPLPEAVQQPADNPASAEKIRLGKQLFFDPRLLGADSKLSCNSCHTLETAGVDGKTLSQGQGGQVTYRSTPTLWNIGFQTVLYWDGRSTSLEAQTLDHLRNPVISSDANLGQLVQRLYDSPDYRAAFAAAFPGEDPVSADNVARALASFERSLLTPDSPFDRYMRGEENAISAAAKRGMVLFNDSGCVSCHFGINFAGPAPGPAMGPGDGFYELFPNHLGTPYDARYGLADDLGRFEYTGNLWEKYMWRVPILRNIALTAPYFHNGRVATLNEAVRVMAKTQLKREFSDRQVHDIVEFLSSLSGKMTLE